MTAPIAGRVSRAIVTAGNLVDASIVLTTVVSDGAVYAYFDVDEQTYLEHVQQSHAAEHSVVHVGLINEEGYPHAARLDFVDNQVDPNHGTIRARAVLDNRDGQFTPGLFARMKLVSPTRYSAALVDDRAIGTDLGKRFVFVVDEQGVVQYRSVETGRLVDGLRVVDERPRGRRRRHRQRPAARAPRRDCRADARRHGPRSCPRSRSLDGSTKPTAANAAF